MIGSKVLAFASGVAMLSSLSFAWSISGTVVSESGEGIPEVIVNAFNLGSVKTTTDAAGKFAISSEASTAIQASAIQQMAVHYEGSTLYIDGVNAQSLNIALIDALGKVMYKKNFRNVYGNLFLDLSKISGQRASFLRITDNDANSTYALTSKGALLKEGDKLPMFMFAKDGYDNVSYQMQQEVESNVKITLKKATQANPGSSSGWNPGQNPWGQKSSSSTAPSAQASSSSVKQDNPASSTSVDVGVNCAGKSYNAGDHKMSVNVDGKNRTFIMHVPSAYKGDKAVPLVVDYHPIGGSGQGELGSSPYKGKTDPEGVITLYPDGTAKPGGMGNGWNVGPCCSNDDDIKFSREMIKAVQEKTCIDPKRIYATGFSMGGGMSNHVACNMADVYAAVAPAAMDLNTTNSAQCNPPRPISIIMFRGTQDPVCRYGGGDSGFNDGLNFLGAEKNFKFWAEKNGCSGSPSKNSNGCDEYSSCKDGTKVILCTKQGGGHDYGDANIGWPFLKSFTMP